MAFSRILILIVLVNFAVFEHFVVRRASCDDQSTDEFSDVSNKFVGKSYILGMVLAPSKILTIAPPQCLQIYVTQNETTKENNKAAVTKRIYDTLIDVKQFSAEVVGITREEFDNFFGQLEITSGVIKDIYNDGVVLKGPEVILLLSRNTSLSKRLWLKYLYFATANNWRFYRISHQHCT